MFRPGVALAGAAIAVVVVGCGTEGVPAGTVATEAAHVLAERTGVRSEVTCPQDLQADVGQELRCVLVPEGGDERYGVTVRVTSVDGDQVDVDVEVDDVPAG